VALSVYVATLSKDRTDGDDRRMAADSMVRHHEAAIRLGVSLFADADPDDNLTPDDSVSVAPFFDVLDWNSALARDTQNRLWVVTYLGQGAGTTLTTISDPGIAGISYELQRLDFRSGTYGLWNAPTLALDHRPDFVRHPKCSGEQSAHSNNNPGWGDHGCDAVRVAVNIGSGLRP
jgi:hypothetical protein